MGRGKVTIGSLFVGLVTLVWEAKIIFDENTALTFPLTLKGRGYFTNEKGGGGVPLSGPPVISARSNGKRLIFSGY